MEITSGDGMTALHVAVAKNHTEIVKLLLAAGSNVNYKTHENMTPLHFAASRGFLDMVSNLACMYILRSSSDSTLCNPMITLNVITTINRS